jgi:hypothetical protein
MEPVVTTHSFETFNAAVSSIKYKSRCVRLSVGDEPCYPVLDHFGLIDFAFIVDTIVLVKNDI